MKKRLGYAADTLTTHRGVRPAPATATIFILAGRELAPWFGFVVIHLRRIASAMIWLLAKVVWLVIALLYAVVVVIDGVIELLAAPMTALFSRRVQPAS